ncbi:MAG: C40 family peptidase [Bacteroidales bacterium]|nr:C40 family peptidase [Bacteroidales bacterium]MBK8882746.1 C40 family peptidase [Bacteroidales bacterium]
MAFKTLFTLLFLSISSLLWSQENMYSEFGKRLFNDAHEMLVKAEVEKSQKRAGNTNEYVFSQREDTSMKYKILRNSIISKAHNYLGVSYRYGQSSEKGFDCSGFVKYIFRNFGLELPHSSYSLYKISKHIDTAEAQSGDLVFFITRGKGVSHVGIYLGNNQFIHSPGRGRTVSIDSLSADYYKRRLVGFGSVL